MPILALCCGTPIALMLIIMGLTSLYTAVFNQEALVEGHPQASAKIAAGIAVVMGSIVTLVGISLFSHLMEF